MVRGFAAGLFVADLWPNQESAAEPTALSKSSIEHLPRSPPAQYYKYAVTHRYRVLG